ncbi:MAG: Met0+ like-protein, partial [Bacteroidota bacterium]
MIDFNGFDWGDSSENFKNLLTREFSKHNSYEKFFQVEAGDIVVDLGASVGPFTWSILNKNPSQCYAVEALSKYLPILYNNIGRSNVKIFNYAIPISNE